MQIVTSFLMRRCTFLRAIKYFDSMISLFSEKVDERATLALYDLLEELNLPEGTTLSINNIPPAESGILFEGGRPVDISLANCFTMQDVVRELLQLLAKHGWPVD